MSKQFSDFLKKILLLKGMGKGKCFQINICMQHHNLEYVYSKC